MSLLIGKCQVAERGLKDGIVVPARAYDSSLELEPSAQSYSSTQKLIYDGSGDVIALYEGREYLLYFDWIWRFWIYFDTPAHAVSYLAAFGFFFGAWWFIVGTFSALSLAVQATQRTNSCGTDAYSWWTSFTYLVGDITWLSACMCQIFESLNLDYDSRIEAWENNKRRGPKPRYRFFGLRLTHWDWWGAVFYEVGVAMYTTAQIFTYLSLCPSVHISATAYTWLTSYLFMGAGVLFLFAGLFYLIDLGSGWIYPNIFIPLERSGWTSMMWWIIWTYFWGGVLFFMSGIFLYWYSPTNMKLSLRTYQIENSIGFGGGSFLFLVGGMLLLMRQSRGRCRPSFAPLTTNCDLSVHGGTSGGQGGQYVNVSGIDHLNKVL